MLCTCFAAIVATSCIIGLHTAAAQTLPTLDTARVLAALESEARETHAPGASIAVVIGDRIAFASAIGTASVETGQPMTPQTLVRIGSVTKSFTGITAALMAHAGDVDLNAPVSRYARGLHQSIGDRSLNALLGHAAGLTNEAATDGLHDDAALGARVRSWKSEHVFAPVGDVYSYSSPGFWLSRVLARATPLPGNDCSYSFGLSTCTRGDAATVGHYGFRVGSGAVFTMIPSKRIAVVVLSNRNGGIMQRTEQSVLGMLAPVAEPSRTAPAIAKSPLSSAMRESVVGVYVSGADTLRLTVRGDSLVYQFGRETQRAKLADSVTVQVLDAGGAVAQEFAIVRGARSASKYLHDGLSAYRRVQRARTH